jgi:16S rRNA (uracil1498-N3)-methyltransferase
VNIFYQPAIADGVLTLDPDEARHCVRVLRKKAGDVISITDGKGFFYQARLTQVDARACKFEILETQQIESKNYTIHIAISPTKNADRIEWFVEKCVELGIDDITLLDCEHTERTFIKTDRLLKVAISAMKQSLKATLPNIHALQPFNSLVHNCNVQEKFIAYVDFSNPIHLKDLAKPNQSYLLLIGPEGDFSNDELMLAQEKGFKKVSLGTSRLRTETAGIAGCHILNLVNS